METARESLLNLWSHVQKHPILFTTVTLATLVAVKKLRRKRVGGGTVLEFEIGGQEIVEGRSGDLVNDWLLRMDDKVVVLRDVIDAIILASQDPDVIGLVGTFKSTLPSNIGLAQIQELRKAVLQFRAAGKPSLFFCESFGEWGHGLLKYWIASAFSEIYMPQAGFVGLVGMMIGHPYIRGTLDKLGISAELYRRKGYKSAPNFFTETKMTEEEKEVYEALMDSVYSDILADISADRAIDPSELKQTIEEGPYGAEEALGKGLLTGVVYSDEFYDKIIPAKFPSKKKLLYLSLYLKKTEKLDDSLRNAPLAVSLPSRIWMKYKEVRAPHVAIINAAGPIHLGKSADRFSGSTSIGHQTVCYALRQAIDDKKVKAIILRVNSPGGSYTASDAMYREVLRAKENGKKVIISMSSMAASGGYYISMPADKIVADSMTVTGSIGVFLGKIVIREGMEKIGITFDYLHTSRNSKMYSSVEPYDEEDKEIVNRTLDRIYDDFVNKAAQGRNKTHEELEQVAQGRIWTGKQAKQIGLVDEVGGLREAIDITKQELGVPLDCPIRLKTFPSQSFIEFVRPKENSRKGPPSSMGIFSGITSFVLSPFSEMMSAIRLMNQYGSLLFPAIFGYSSSASSGSLASFSGLKQLEAIEGLNSMGPLMVCPGLELNLRG